MSNLPALIEIGCEELPPKALLNLANAFKKELSALLMDANLTFGSVDAFAAPRRLALIIKDLATEQPDNQVVRRGPALAAAFDASNKPTGALQGFMRSVGLEDPALLERIETDKGTWLSYTVQQTGKNTRDLLPDLINAALKRLPIPKPMRWGNHLTEFVRPVHWVLLLFGSEVIARPILGVVADRITYGHRFMAPNAISIQHPDEYLTKLEAAFVLADFMRRRDLIAETVMQLAQTKQAKAVLEPDLLNEVTGLVEWPVPLCVDFNPDFLRIPQEALVAAMRGHQKCFSLVDADGKLLPKFITVANIQSQDQAVVIAGNARVMRARLSDAAFFFDEDSKTPLATRLPLLKQVTFQAKLGSLYDKSQRLAHVASSIAKRLQVSSKDAERAGMLCQCDLLSNMVGEFAELQGIMGRYYATLSGESQVVANALSEFYHPAFAKDQLPQDPVSDALALADRLDTMVGIFGIGQKPTGEKDPFGLRRAALGIVRILVEKKYALDVESLIEDARAQYPDGLIAESVVGEVHHYILDRLRSWYVEAGFPVDAINAVLARQTRNFIDIDNCLRAVEAFRQLPQAIALAAANKRVSRILQKESDAGKQLNYQLLSDDSEKILADALMAKREEIIPYCEQGQYQQALTSLAQLQEPVDRFFEDVMVMVDDEAVRHNRLALLSELRQLFLRVADISLLQ